jgi:DNA transformation protein
MKGLLLYFCKPNEVNPENFISIVTQMNAVLKLEDLPNIGHTLADLLRKAGIETPEDLFEAGTFQAYIRIQAVDPEACYSKLCAIEGALEGIRWHSLSAEKKMELKQFFALIHK